jgi:hypothetical protein
MLFMAHILLHQFAFLNGAELFFIFFHTGPRNYGKDLLRKFSPKEYSQLTVNPMTSNNTSFLSCSHGSVIWSYVHALHELNCCTCTVH